MHTCQGLASAWKGVLREGVSGSVENKQLKVKLWVQAEGICPPQDSLLDLPSLCSAFSGDLQTALCLRQLFRLFCILFYSRQLFFSVLKILWIAHLLHIKSPVIDFDINSVFTPVPF